MFSVDNDYYYLVTRDTNIIVLNGNEWVTNKLTKVEPDTQLPFTCIDNKKYKYCMPYTNRTYDYVYTDKEVDPIYDISIK